MSEILKLFQEGFEFTDLQMIEINVVASQISNFPTNAQRLDS